MNSGQRLIDNALKVISGCIIPISAIINNGSMSTTYLGSVLTNSSFNTRLNSEKSSSASNMLSDVHQFGDLTADMFATTLFPVSAIFNSCFRHERTSADSAVCQSAILTFGAGNCYKLFSLIIVYKLSRFLCHSDV